MARSWKIHIPHRPKAVQSVRGGRNGFYPDHKVRQWKNMIRPYIAAACDGPPTELPLRIVRIRHVYRWPKATRKSVREYIQAGGLVPCIGSADITDNLNKGLIDTCAGLVFVNDKLIWHMGDVEKVYGPDDCIEIEFEETPDVLMIDGRRADGSPFAAGTLL